MTQEELITLRKAHDMLWDALVYMARLYHEPWETQKYLDVAEIIQPLRWQLARELRPGGLKP